MHLIPVQGCGKNVQWGKVTFLCDLFHSTSVRKVTE